MLETYSDILTVKEVREILFIGKNLMYDLLESGKLCGFKVGRAWRVSKEEVISYINNRC